MGRMKDLHIEICEDIEKAQELIEEVKTDLAISYDSNSYTGIILYQKLELARLYLSNALKLSDWES